MANVGKYTSPMDPMGLGLVYEIRLPAGGFFFRHLAALDTWTRGQVDAVGCQGARLHRQQMGYQG